MTLIEPDPPWTDRWERRRYERYLELHPGATVEQFREHERQLRKRLIDDQEVVLRDDEHVSLRDGMRSCTCGTCRSLREERRRRRRKGGDG